MSERSSKPNTSLNWRLILSSDVEGLNYFKSSSPKKLNKSEPSEFRYALGLSRPLRISASPKPCTFCLGAFVAGA